MVNEEPSRVICTDRTLLPLGGYLGELPFEDVGREAYSDEDCVKA
jgi:hypothetical protein